MVMQRRIAMGLLEPEVLTFANACEFVSLGCFCGATRALQCLDLKQRTYPFDWVRSDVAGVLHCLRSGFQDFASSSFSQEHFAGVDNKFYGGTTWGGSFWHHNPHDPVTKANFERRFARLRSLDGDEAGCKTCVFLIALNSSNDLLLIPELRIALQDMLPGARILLLVFIDNQDVQGPLRLAGDAGHDTIFYRTNERIFANNGQLWTEQGHAELYAEGVATALHAWAGTCGGTQAIREVSDIACLHSQCIAFHGGDPSRALYWPGRLQSTHMVRPAPLVENTMLETMDGCTGKDIDGCSWLPWPFHMLGA